MRKHPSRRREDRPTVKHFYRLIKIKKMTIRAQFDSGRMVRKLKVNLQFRRKKLKEVSNAET